MKVLYLIFKNTLRFKIWINANHYKQNPFFRHWSIFRWWVILQRAVFQTSGKKAPKIHIKELIFFHLVYFLVHIWIRDHFLRIRFFLICTQHQKDQALSDRCCTTSCPGPCHFLAGLQCSSGWTFIKHNQTSTNDSEFSGTTGLQRAQKSPCHTSLYILALATSCSSHPVQDTDACI